MYLLSKFTCPYVPGVPLLKYIYLCLLSVGFHVVQKLALWCDRLPFEGDLFVPTAFFFNSPFYSEITIDLHVVKCPPFT